MCAFLGSVLFIAVALVNYLSGDESLLLPMIGALVIIAICSLFLQSE